MATDPAHNGREPALVAWLCGIGAGLLLARSVWISQFGFDLTDESFYLLWMRDPWRYPVSVSQFGFVYHPLYHLVQGDIAALRSTTIILTFALGAILSYRCLARLKHQESRQQRFLLSLAFGASALLLFSNGLMTPSYNSLTFQGLILAAIGGLWIATSHRFPNAAMASLMLALGGVVVFLAKPSSAALLGPLVFLYLVARMGAGQRRGFENGQRSVPMRRLLVPALLSVALAAALMLASAYAISGGPLGFANRLRNGMEQAALLGGGHNLASIVRLDFPRPDAAAKRMIAMAVIGALVLRLALLNRRYRSQTLLAAAGAALVTIALLCWNPNLFSLKANQYQGLIMLAIPLVALTFAPEFLSSDGALRRYWPETVLLAMLPYALAFGSNAHYWQLGSLAALFWILGATFLVRTPWAIRMLAILALLGTGWIMAITLQNPYRQPGPLTAYRTPMPDAAAKVKIDAGLAQQLVHVAAVARQAGLNRGDAIIDLTGQSPGLIYSLKAKAMGQPWLLGGYPGSEAAATAALAQESCADLAAAWLISEEGQVRSLPPSVLNSFGSDKDRDYQIVGSWMTAPGFRDATKPVRQYLHRPDRPKDSAVAQCRQSRASAAHSG